MFLDQLIKTDLFTGEELQIIQETIDRGDIQSVMRILPSVDMSPIKEIEIQKLKDFYSNSTPGYSDAEVRKSWHGRAETPEEELERQKQLNVHKHAWMMAHGFKQGTPFVSPELASIGEKKVKKTEDVGVVAPTEDKPVQSKKKPGRPKKVVEA